ncbi:MAG: hypothetical protein KGJ01_03245 [Patescibacteria group bacterium]|nr:hypothetical protein [Patescibacteria group bacterium]
MKSIVFATTNERKIGEARLACQKFGIEIEQVKLEINEIQSGDPKKISREKAKAAYTQAGKPLVVTDTFWNIPALNGFPGGYMKEVAGWFKEEDFLNLIKDKNDRRISFTESVTYIDGDELKEFSKEFWGVIANEPRGIGNSIENIAEFDGFTIGERRAQNSFSHKAEDYIWIDFAKWFVNRYQEERV